MGTNGNSVVTATGNGNCDEVVEDWKVGSRRSMELHRKTCV